MSEQITQPPPRAPDSRVSWREFLGQGYGAALALVCLAVWLHAADSLIVATMMPAIVEGIGGAAFVSWSVSIYEIGSIVAGAAAALAVLRHGLRAPMVASAALFGAGCAMAALAPRMEVLLAGRLLQGVGGGGLVAMCFVAVGLLFERRYVARTMAVVSGFWGLSAFMGPLVGGIFVEYLDWRAGFWFFAAQAGALAIWIALRRDFAEVGRGAVESRLSLGRLALLCLAVVLISAGGLRVELLRSSLLIGAGALCLWLFLRRDARAGGDRLLPPAPFDMRRPTGATLLMLLLLPMATIPILAYGPLLMTALHGATALEAGYIVACSSIGWTLTAVAVSGAPERHDRHWIAAGMALTAAGVLAYVYAVPHGPLWLIGAVALVEGGGMGLAYTFVLRRITALVPESEVGRVSGAIPTVQRMGYALGAAYVGVVANAGGFLTMTAEGREVAVTRLIFASCVPLALVGLVAMWGLVRRQPYDDTL
jgi:MFS family permease